MKRRASSFIPLLILVLALGLRINDPAPIEQARLLVFDSYQRLKPRIYDPAVPVKIIDIDDESLARHGQWPWPRTTMGRLIDRLTQMGAAVIALDLVFADPDRSSPEHILPLWPGIPEVKALRGRVQDLPSHDRIFAEAIGRSRVVTGFVLTHKDGTRLPAVKGTFVYAGDDPKPFVPAFSGAVTNLPKLEAAALGNGALNWIPDRDQVVRRLPLVFRVGDTLYPSLLAETLRVAQGARSHVIKSSGASGETAFGEHTGLNAVRIGGGIVPTDARGRMLVHYTKSVPERYIPAWRVLEPDFDRERVAGQIVLIGTSAVGLFDLRATPLDAAVPGVEVHAQAIEQILAGSFLRRPDFADAAEITYMLVIGLLLIFLLPRIGAPWSAALGGGAIAAVIAASWFAYDGLGWMVDPVYPSFVVSAAFLSDTVLAYLRSEAERRQIRGAFSRYMSPALVEQLAAHPERLVLGGEMREMTLLFCDIRGFTTIAEQFDAQGLTGFINRFLTPMTDVILSSRGTIDKYMGDCIMAFWNAPLDEPEHASNGCRAALAMGEKLASLNEAWRAEAEAAGKRYIPVKVGIGLNTGLCCVGNMGSDQRFDYSVLGDDVNLASRLEGQTKTYGVDIIIGENTEKLVPNFATLELDVTRVKGKTEPTRIYALLGDETVANSPEFMALEERHGEMLGAFRMANWDIVPGLINESRRLADGRLDEFYDFYDKRVETYLT